MYLQGGQRLSQSWSTPAISHSTALENNSFSSSQSDHLDLFINKSPSGVRGVYWAVERVIVSAVKGVLVQAALGHDSIRVCQISGAAEEELDVTLRCVTQAE